MVIFSLFKAAKALVSLTSFDHKQTSPVLFIDLICKAYSVDHSELEANVALLQLVSVGFELYSRLIVLCRFTLKFGVEQGIHESGLSQTRLAWKKHSNKLPGSTFKP